MLTILRIIFIFTPAYKHELIIHHIAMFKTMYVFRGKRAAISYLFTR